MSNILRSHSTLKARGGVAIVWYSINRLIVNEAIVGSGYIRLAWPCAIKRYERE